MSATPNPYGEATFRGKPLDNATISALRKLEAVLGYQLTIVQGIGGAKASAGTHLEGRCVDLAPYDGTNKLNHAKDLGFAGWERDDLPGVWGAHVHMALIFESRKNEKGIAPAGFRQIAAFDAKRDGLKSNLADTSYRPKTPQVYTLDEFKREVEEISATPVTKMRDRLVEAHYDLGKAIAFARAADSRRTVVKAQIAELRTMRRGLADILATTPKR